MHSDVGEPSPPASLGLLVFPDPQFEARYIAFRGWHLRNMPPRVSLFIGLSWLAALLALPKQLPWGWSWWNCAARTALCALITLLHLTVWAASGKLRSVAVGEVPKCRLFLVNLTVAMMYVILQKDMNEVPGGNHAAGMAVHGWWIVFVSFRLQTALLLHLINHLVYLLCEAKLAILLGHAAILNSRNLAYYAAVTLGATVVPLAVTACNEVDSRQEFMLRCGRQFDYSHDRIWQAVSGSKRWFARRVRTPWRTLRAHAH